MFAMEGKKPPSKCLECGKSFNEVLISKDGLCVECQVTETNNELKGERRFK